MAAGKKDFSAVPTRTAKNPPKSLEELMGEGDDSGGLDSKALAPPAPAAAVPTDENKPARKQKKTLADKWGAYTVQKNFRVPIRLIEALAEHVKVKKEDDRKFTETQAVTEALEEYLKRQGIDV